MEQANTTNTNKILLGLKLKGGKRLLSDKEVDELCSLPSRIVSDDDLEVLEQVMQLLLSPSLGFQGTLDFLKKCKNSDDVLFFNPMMSTARIEKELQDEKLRQKPPKVSASINCPACNGTNTDFSTKQTSRADEPTSLFIYCRDCRKQFKT